MKLSELVKDRKIKIHTFPNGAPSPEGGFGPGATAWVCVLTFDGRALAVPFFCGSAHHKFVDGSKVAVPPGAADVLSCLLLDSSAADMPFTEWCADMGHDDDSRTAYATWEICARQARDLATLLGADFDTFRNAENDL